MTDEGHTERLEAALDGRYRIERKEQCARRKGLTEVMHGLMHSANNSTNIGKNRRLFRRYTLYRKDLG